MSDQVIKNYCTIENCFAFKLPPRTGAGQYSAKQWGDHVWQGTCKMVAKGDKGLIILEDADGMFAKSPVEIDTILEGVVDSSRYFVLKAIVSGGKKAYIGIGFGDRSNAFDLKSAIQRFQTILKAEKEAKTSKNEPVVDLSLAQGQEIKINLTNKIKKTSRPGEKKSKKVGKKKSKGKKESVPEDWVTF
ncbi:hypothetical protein AAMO2058_000718900 [Amorphochlora amoebiformis]